MSEYSEKLKMNAHWAKYISNTLKYKYNFCEGAYRSSKSVSNILAFAMYLEETPDRLHLVIASTVSSARNIVEDGDGALGLKYYFAGRYKETKYKNHDAGIIQTKNGPKTVVYLGGLMESSYKDFRGWSCGGIVLEEANLLHPNTITEAKGRVLMAQQPKFFISMNPSTATCPIYQWLDELIEKKLVNYDKSTIYDNPAITQERIQEIISEFDPNSIFYRQKILGERVNAEGVVYTLRDYNTFSGLNVSDYIAYVIVCDIGDGPSATVFECVALRKGFKGCDVIAEYRHRNDDKENRMNPKQPIQYAEDLALFTRSCIDLFQKPPKTVIIDGSNAFYRDCRDAFGKNSIGFLTIQYPYKEEIDERIRYSSSLLYLGRIRFKDTCNETIKSFSQVEYDPKAYEKGIIKYNDQPTLGTRCDEIDATLYGVYYFQSDLARVSYDVHVQGGING